MLTDINRRLVSGIVKRSGMVKLSDLKLLNLVTFE